MKGMLDTLDIVSSEPVFETDTHSFVGVSA
jgi:hypothetical protein